MKNTLNLYNKNNTWFFDDSVKDIIKEPFVSGSSELITEIQKRAQLSGDTVSITFSDKPFSDSINTLIWKDSRDNGTWNKYYSKDLDMENWLCPVLLVYFEKAPVMLYVSLS